MYSNGAATASQSVTLGGTVADGDAFVVSRTDADQTIVAVADQLAPAVINFNGDDAVVLRKAGALVDAFGQVGVDPGTEWTGGGADDVLRHASSVCAGDTDTSDAFDASIEWVVFPLTTFDGLGSHTADCDDTGGGDDPPPVRFNELHYDNEGTDAAEAIEVVGPAGTDLTGWSIVLYNGATGAVYNTASLTGTIADLDGTGTGVVVVNYPSNGIQNGAPDGMALVDGGGSLIEFLSYEGTFTVVGGPADGVTSTDIGAVENGSSSGPTCRSTATPKAPGRGPPAPRSARSTTPTLPRRVPSRLLS